MRIPSCVSAPLRLMGGSQVNPGCSEDLSVSQLAWEGLNKPVGPMEVLSQQKLSAHNKAAAVIPVTSESMAQDKQSFIECLQLLKLACPKNFNSNEPNTATTENNESANTGSFCQTHPNFTLNINHF